MKEMPLCVSVRSREALSANGNQKKKFSPPLPFLGEVARAGTNAVGAVFHAIRKFADRFLLNL